MIYKYADEYHQHLRRAKLWHKRKRQAVHPDAVRVMGYWRDVYLEAARLALEKHYDLNGR